MRSLRKKEPFILVYLMIMFAVGTAVGEILPQSSYYSYTSYYNGTTDGIVVESSVYNRDALTGEAEAEFSDSIEIEGQYIYAYQIYNGNGSFMDISEFSIYGIGNTDPEDYAIDDEDQITTMEDTFNDPGQEATGIDADNYQLSGDHSQVAWYFSGESGVIGIGDHSYYLIIVSDHDMTLGTYDFEGIQDDVVVVPNPEPCTIALLGVGGLILRRTGRRYR